MELRFFLLVWFFLTVTFSVEEGEGLGRRIYRSADKLSF